MPEGDRERTLLLEIALRQQSATSPRSRDGRCFIWHTESLNLESWPLETSYGQLVLSADRFHKKTPLSSPRKPALAVRPRLPALPERRSGQDRTPSGRDDPSRPLHRSRPVPGRDYQITNSEAEAQRSVAVRITVEIRQEGTMLPALVVNLISDTNSGRSHHGTTSAIGPREWRS